VEHSSSISYCYCMAVVNVKCTTKCVAKRKVYCCCECTFWLFHHLYTTNNLAILWCVCGGYNFQIVSK